MERQDLWVRAMVDHRDRRKWNQWISAGLQDPWALVWWDTLAVHDLTVANPRQTAADHTISKRTGIPVVSIEPRTQTFDVRGICLIPLFLNLHSIQVTHRTLAMGWWCNRTIHLLDTTVTVRLLINAVIRTPRQWVPVAIPRPFPADIRPVRPPATPCHRHNTSRSTTSPRTGKSSHSPHSRFSSLANDSCNNWMKIVHPSML